MEFSEERGKIKEPVKPLKESLSWY